MPRCLSLRASESNWATLGDFSGFSVDSDFANGRYPEYRSSAPVLRHPRFGTARQPPPEFDKFRSRMNSESPLRISSMVLTVCSILCCITAVSYLAPKLTPRLNSTDPAIIAANALQMNLSEFQTKGGGGPMVLDLIATRISRSALAPGHARRCSAGGSDFAVGKAYDRSAIHEWPKPACSSTASASCERSNRSHAARIAYHAGSGKTRDSIGLQQLCCRSTAKAPDFPDSSRNAVTGFEPDQVSTIVLTLCSLTQRIGLAGPPMRNRHRKIPRTYSSSSGTIISIMLHGSGAAVKTMDAMEMTSTAMRQFLL